MWKDVEEYVRTCPTCQMTNDAKFQKAPAPLHPIEVKSKVWHQASHNNNLSQYYWSWLKLLYFLIGWSRPRWPTAKDIHGQSLHHYISGFLFEVAWSSSSTRKKCCLCCKVSLSNDVSVNSSNYYCASTSIISSLSHHIIVMGALRLSSLTRAESLWTRLTNTSSVSPTQSTEFHLHIIHRQMVL